MNGRAEKKSLFLVLNVKDTTGIKKIRRKMIKTINLSAQEITDIDLSELKRRIELINESDSSKYITS